MAVLDNKLEVPVERPRVALVGVERSVLETWAVALGDDYEIDVFDQPERALRRLEIDRHDVVVVDMDMPDHDAPSVVRRLRRAQPTSEAIVLSGDDSADAVVAAMRLGATDFIVKTDLSPPLLPARVADAVERTRRAEPPPPSSSASTLHGECAAMQHVRKLIDRFAGSNLPVMVLGASGTGKEVVARALHAASGRAGMPFVAINCAGIADTLIDSELFGYERGAFTGANANHMGLFDAAAGGTLFLDEIGDMPPSTQVRLLRTLQEGEVRPVGATKAHHVDVRIISATNMPLKEAVASGRFRQDLYFRLSPIKIDLPTLRSRGGDILVVAEHILAASASQARRRKPKLSQAVERALMAYDWPGNVRELKSALEYALSLARGDTIEIEDLPPSVGIDPRKRSDAFVPVSVDAPPPNYLEKRKQWLAETDRRYFRELLRYTKGNLSEASRHSGVDRSNLRRLLKDLGISAVDFRPREA